MAGDENELLHQVTCIAREYRDGILDDTLMVREMKVALATPTPEDGRWGELAELLAADKAYDEARAALENRDPHLKKLADVGAMIDRLEWAKERRANALAQAERQVEHVCPFCNQLAHMGPCDAQRHGGR